MKYILILFISLFFYQCQSLHAKSSILKQFDDALVLKKEKQFEKATESFKKFLDKNPNHTLSKKAHLLIGDIYFETEEFEKASLQYKQFNQKYPSDLNKDYILYQIGQCYEKRSPNSIDLDISLAKKALPYYRIILQKHKKSSYFKKALSASEKIVQMNIDKQKQIGTFYFNRKKYKVALSYYANILKKFPSTKKDSQLLFKASVSACKDNRNKQAQKLYGLLKKQFPLSKERKKLEKVLQEC